MTEETSESKIRAQQQQESRKEHLQRIGARLRRRREARGLDQHEVAQQLHLPGMVVNDIETGRIGTLSGIYRRGYIRNYANLLGLDADELLAEAGEEVPPELKEVMPAPQREWRLERYLKVATYLIVTIAIVPPLVYFFVAGGSRMLEREPAVSETPAVNESEDRAVVSGLADADKGRDNDAEDEPEPERHVSASAFPVTPLKPMHEARPQSPAGEPGESEARPAEAETEAAGPALTALQLDLVADSWIEIRDARGERLEYDLLREGQSHRYEGEAPFRVLLGRSSAVELHIDGRPVVWEGHESGDLAELEITDDGAVER